MLMNRNEELSVTESQALPRCLSTLVVLLKTWF